MPLTKENKAELLAEYQGGLAKAQHAFLVGYQGISVPQVTDLRAKVRSSGGEYVVVKNTLALRAIDSTAMGQLKEHFTGATAVVYSLTDPVAIAKTLTDFAKDTPALKFKGGIVEGRTVPAEQIKEIAQLPSRDQLLAKLLFLMQSPIQRFAQVLNAIPQSFVIALNEVRKQKEEQA